jgi:hypothetical protein
LGKQKLACRLQTNLHRPDDLKQRGDGHQKEEGKKKMNILPQVDFFGGLALGIASAFAVILVLTVGISGGIVA